MYQFCSTSLDPCYRVQYIGLQDWYNKLVVLLKNAESQLPSPPHPLPTVLDQLAQNPHFVKIPVDVCTVLFGKH